MNNLYQSKLATEPHIVKAIKYRDFLSVKEPISETGKAYLCQRQLEVIYDDVPNNPFYSLDERFEPFIMSEDIFESCYSPLGEQE